MLLTIVQYDHIAGERAVGNGAVAHGGGTATGNTAHKVGTIDRCGAGAVFDGTGKVAGEAINAALILYCLAGKNDSLFITKFDLKSIN